MATSFIVWADAFLKDKFQYNKPKPRLQIIKRQGVGKPPINICPFSGTFVGMVADNPDEKIEKVFYSKIQNDHAAIKAEEDKYQPIPKIDKVTTEDIQENYLMIKADIQILIDTEISILKAKKEAEVPVEQSQAQKEQENPEDETSNNQSMSM